MLELPSTKRIEVGVDEAGRGPLAFDVYSAAVVMPTSYDPDDKFVEMIKDSKKVTEKRRIMLTTYIEKTAIAYGIGTATVAEIDEYNILKATYMAMHRAIDRATEMLTAKGFCLDHIMVDGDKFKPYISKQAETWVPYTCCVDGDAKYLNIAAASILAKTHRDNAILQIVNERPDLDDKYGFLKNKGYGTAKHMIGLQTYGACEYHRRSYAPVQHSMR